MTNRILISLLFMAVTAASAAGPPDQRQPEVPPGVDATGGPDAYGYTWIDSDEPGGPQFNWIDISSIGTLVEGLSDDNYVGPIPIGFNFTYYWYGVEQYYLGSNGYLKFGSAYNISQAFPPSIPLASVPNDFIAVYVADWWFGQPTMPDSCLRWTNSIDTCIVSWINVPAWMLTGPEGSHNFQVILSGADSSITFQYGSQDGQVFNTDMLIGIESLWGQIGLEHSHDTYAPPNYAVRFQRTDTLTVPIHDLGTIASANPTSEGFSVLNGSPVQPWGKIKNFGSQTETGYTVNCTVQSVSGSIIYNQTTSPPPIAPGQELEVSFASALTPTVNAVYSHKVTVNLAGDINSTNNLKTAEMQVLTLPGMLFHEDGTAESAWDWTGSGQALAQRFVPPVYPIELDSIRFYVAGAGTAVALAKILDDDGPGGGPGAVLYEIEIPGPPTGWRALSVAAANIVVYDGAFYVVWESAFTNSPELGLDASAVQPVSRQGWQFTNAWGSFVNRESQDLMIRARINAWSGFPSVEVALEPYGAPIVIPESGGAFNFNVALTNNEALPQTFQGWCMLTLPNGTQFGPTLGATWFTIPGGISRDWDRTQEIPGYAPPGNYLCFAYAGIYPDTVWDSDFFPLTKLAMDQRSKWIDDWSNEKETFGGVCIAVPASFSLNGNHPNPFNPSTSISFSLPQAEQVTLSVYDVQGHQVAELVNGWRDAGSHSVVFDGAKLASGIYLYRLTAGNFDATGKMVLMK